MSRFTCIYCGASTTGQYLTEQSFERMMGSLRAHLVTHHLDIYESRGKGVNELLDCFHETDDSNETKREVTK